MAALNSNVHIDPITRLKMWSNRAIWKRLRFSVWRIYKEQNRPAEIFSVVKSSCDDNSSRLHISHEIFWPMTSAWMTKNKPTGWRMSEMQRASRAYIGKSTRVTNLLNKSFHFCSDGRRSNFSLIRSLYNLHLTIYRLINVHAICTGTEYKIDKSDKEINNREIEK